jgi:hypothetical protein
MRFAYRLLASVAFLLPWLAGPAAAISITLEGPSTGVFTTGLRVASGSAGDTITVTVGLDAAVSLNGYDLTIAWDATELSLLSAADLSGLGLDTAPPGLVPGGERIATLELLPVVTASLFELSFHVEAVVGDGLADFSLLLLPANGSGLSPGGLSIDNPSLPALAIPEPAVAALLLLGLAGLAAADVRR